MNDLKTRWCEQACYFSSERFQPTLPKAYKVFFLTIDKRPIKHQLNDNIQQNNITIHNYIC